MSIYKIKYESEGTMETMYVGATSEYAALHTFGQSFVGSWFKTDGGYAHVDAFSGAHIIEDETTSKYDHVVLTSRSGFVFKIPVEIERVNPQDVEYGTEILYYRKVWDVSALTDVLIELLRGDELDKPCAEDAEALITFTDYSYEDLITIKRGVIEYF